MSEKPAPAKGLKRIWKAIFYSLSGLKLAFRDEAAFRQELVLILILTPLCLLLSVPVWLKAMILFSYLLILIVELLNTAIESIVDKTTPEFHLDAKKAKDTSSSAVFFSLILAGGLWVYALWLVLL